MKKTMNIFRAMALAVIATAAFTACSDDETYDVMGNPDNLVYFKANADNTFRGTVVHTPVGHFGALKAVFPVRIQRPAAHDTRVTAVIDNSLIEAYNADHGTSYIAMPAEAIDASQLATTIMKDSVKAQSDVVVALVESALAKLTAPAYLLPVRIATVEGDGVGSVERGIGYVVVNTEEKLVKNISDASEMTGSLLTDYSGWTAVYSSGVAIEAADLFDEDVTNGPQLRTDGDAGKTCTVTIDMQQPQSVSGLRLARYYVNYWGWWAEEYYFSAVRIELSNDGQQWTDCGTALDADMPRQDGYQHVAFYTGVPARYLRLTIESGESSVSSLAELGVYVAE